MIFLTLKTWQDGIGAETINTYALYSYLFSFVITNKTYIFVTDESNSHAVDDKSC